jgi:hypothetical protein
MPTVAIFTVTRDTWAFAIFLVLNGSSTVTENCVAVLKVSFVFDKMANRTPIMTLMKIFCAEHTFPPLLQWCAQ